VSAKRPFTLVLFALLAFLAYAQDSPPRVTVLPFEGTGFTKADAQALTLFFETALQNTGRCQIIEQTEVNKILKSHEYALKDFNDPTKAMEIGKLLPANHIVIGTFGTLGDKRYINVKLIDLTTGTIVAARNSTAATLDGLASGFAEMAGRMMGIEPSAAQPSERTQPSAGQPLIIKQASLNFFESANEPQPIGARAYAFSFPTMMTRFVYWELHLDIEPPSGPITFQADALILNPDGSILTRQTVPCRVDAGSLWFKCWMGWGNVNPNNWRPGTYTVNVSIGTQLIAAGFFDIY
jgi:TolB-like protein